MTTARQRITLDEPVKLLVRPVDTETDAVTAAFRFDPDQPRRSDGKWGSGGISTPSTAKPLTGEKALESAPVRLAGPPGGHRGNYEGAGITGPSGHGSPALAEM